MLLGILPWFLLMVAGLVASVALLFWGHRSGQFADQERARYLPFRDEESPAPANGRGRFGPETWALAGLMAGAGIILAIALRVAILKQYGG